VPLACGFLSFPLGVGPPVDARLKDLVVILEFILEFVFEETH
jgi:hypothetical protein